MPLRKTGRPRILVEDVLEVRNLGRGCWGFRIIHNDLILLVEYLRGTNAAENKKTNKQNKIKYLHPKYPRGQISYF